MAFQKHGSSRLAGQPHPQLAATGKWALEEWLESGEENRLRTVDCGLWTAFPRFCIRRNNDLAMRVVV